MKLSRCLILIVIICVVTAPPLSVPASYQTPQALPRQMVILNVRVKDPQGRAVIDVPQSSFVVSENGVPQKISLFMSEQIPLSYGLLIDASASLRTQVNDVLRAAMKIVNSNKPTDEAFVIRFISSDKIETSQALTSDKQALTAALDSMYIEAGQSAILDAVYLSAEYLIQNRPNDENLRRRALIIATDGEERLSYFNTKQVVQLLTSTDIQVYILAFTKALKGDKYEKAVKLTTVLASDTGGRVYFPGSGDLDSIANEIINDIRTQYVIGYIPSNLASKGFQRVEVSIADNPNQEKRVAITRVGYSTSGIKPKEQKSP